MNISISIIWIMSFPLPRRAVVKRQKRPPTSHDMPSSEKSTKRTSAACSFQHPSLKRCVTTQSILWHYIEPITSSIDIDSIAFKCSLGKQLMRWFSQLIEKLFSSFLLPDHQKLYQYFLFFNSIYFIES